MTVNPEASPSQQPEQGKSEPAPSPDPFTGGEIWYQLEKEEQRYHQQEHALQENTAPTEIE